MNKYEGKTLEDAIVVACNDKGVEKENLIYFVVESKEGGLFGIGSKTIIEAFTKEDVAKFIQNYLETYFENLQMKTEVTVQSENDQYLVKLNAENNAIIIGKTGNTLQAITSVTKAAASAEFKRHVNILIDVNNYKEERYEKLKSLVAGIAKTVVKTKVPAKLGKMTNDERKVVHQYLSTFPHIKTESEGEGANRRLKIIYDANN